MTTAERTITFGPYCLDLASGRLLRDGASVPLRLKAFAVLEYLVTHPGRLVGKAELLDAVWSATHVTPSVLTGCIRELRRALDDDARAARFIETVHRRGYRFVAAPAPSTEREAEATEAAWSSFRDHDAELATLARQFALAVDRVVQLGKRQGRPALASDRRAVFGQAWSPGKRTTKSAPGKLR
jgi:DNA-binding winged helix-turn-helix (wHTH) protein